MGVDHIHSKGFAHRNLTPENFLVDKNYDIKIQGFERACSLEGRDKSGKNRSRIGAPTCYIAPEIVAHQPYSGKDADLFALGVILFTLYAGHPPFNNAAQGDNYF